MKAIIKDPTLKKLLSRTPQGLAIMKQITLSGNYEEFLGKGFFKKLGKGLKKIGKFTSPITGRIAKVAAGLIGIPPGAIDALAKVDPSAKNSLIRSLAKSKAGKKAQAVVSKAQQVAPGALSNIKPVYVIAGAGALAAVVVIVAVSKKRG